MKRRLALNLRPTKVQQSSKKLPTPADSTDASSETSSYLEPLSPLIERRDPLSVTKETELRNACALLEQYTNHKPQAKFYEDLAVEDAARRRAERQKERPQADTESLTSGSSKAAGRSQQPKASNSKSSRKNAQGHGNQAGERYVPTNAAVGFSQTLPNTAFRTSSKVSRERRDSDVPSAVGHANERPHTATTRFDSRGTTLRHSAQSNVDARPSTNERNHGASESSAPGGSGQVRQTSMMDRPRDWISQDSTKDPSDEGRPPSRASRIAQFIRPRSSNGSLRSTASTERDSRDMSRTSWWKVGSLRRANSNGSQYSSASGEGGPQVEMPTVDLNRALPPLPSLSTWAPLETDNSSKGRPESLHIAHLMKDFPSPSLSSPSAAAIQGGPTDRRGVARSHTGSSQEKVEKRSGNFSYPFHEDVHSTRPTNKPEENPISSRRTAQPTGAGKARPSSISKAQRNSGSYHSSPTKIEKPVGAMGPRSNPSPPSKRSSQSAGGHTSILSSSAQTAVSMTDQSQSSLSSPVLSQKNAQRKQQQQLSRQKAPFFSEDIESVSEKAQPLGRSKDNEKDPHEVQIVDLGNRGMSDAGVDTPIVKPSQKRPNTQVQAKKISRLRNHFSKLALRGFGGSNSNVNIVRRQPVSVIEERPSNMNAAAGTTSTNRGKKMDMIHPALRPNAAV
ncbi:MAG: hypothetical protein M4579_005277 [Chaenotheca gracillima]|nr:MAG: hypothetical protein M4579_005277 [Chaenotheca gracillima]